MTPQLSSVLSEFLTWLWWASETCSFTGEPPASIWVDERLSFEGPLEGKTVARMTAEDAASTLEARAALTAGRRLREARFVLRDEEGLEWAFSLGTESLDPSGVRLPPAVSDSLEETILFRIDLLSRLRGHIQALFVDFVGLRMAPEWREVEGEIRDWAGESFSGA